MSNKLQYFGIDYPLPISDELKAEIKNCECETGIYKLYVHVVHEETDKYYVGVTKNTLAQRWGRGRYYATSRLHYAIAKHGWDNIDHVVLSTKLNDEDSHRFEIEVIKALCANDIEHGYNIAVGGKGVTGVRRFGTDNHFYGRKHTPDSRRLIRLHHADCSGEKNSFYGKRHSDEARKRMSEFHKGRQMGADSPVARKVINTDTGKVFQTVKEACAYAKSGHVTDVCRGTRSSAGKYEDGTPMHWRYA